MSSTYNGTLTITETQGINFETGDGVDDTSFSITGAIASVNNALNSLTYRSLAGYIGGDTLEVTVNDLANTGIGGAKEVTDTVAITVQEVVEEITLIEGNNFEVIAEEIITIPETSSLLRFNYDLTFDETDEVNINDAFEVALVDSNGNSLVHTIANSRDAFINLTESQVIDIAAGIGKENQTVTVNLTGLAEGEATVIFRLVNNDTDTQTQVTITDIGIEAGDGTPIPNVIPEGAVLSLSANQINFSGLSDVSSSLRAEYGQTSFNDETQTLFTDVKVRNIGTYSVDSPLVMVVKNISNPTVTVINADGLTPQGLPYFDFSSLVDDQFDPTGNLYVGNNTDGRIPSPQNIYKISFLDSVVEEYGNSTIFDPDTVLFDQQGVVSGVPNSVLVGGWDRSTGYISAILPDGTVEVLFSSPDFGNVSSMQFDSRNRLIFSDNETNSKIFIIEN